MAYKITLRTDTAANWTSSNPVLLLGEMGHESDTDKIKLGDGVTAWTSLSYYAEAVSSGLMSSDIGSTIQAYDANLTAIAALTASEGNFIAGNGSTFVKADASSIKNTLGYGTLASQSTFAPTDLSETLSVAKGGTGSTTAGDARTALGLAIDTDVQSYTANVSTDSNIGSTIQAYDSNLTSFVSTFTLPTTDGTASYGVKTDGSTNIGFADIGAGLTVANTADDLPESPSNGESVYVVDEDAFYVWNGSAWRYFTLSEYSSGPAALAYGYLAGGVNDNTPAYLTDIELINFSTDTNGVDSGADLTLARTNAGGVSSDASGYAMGGFTGSRRDTVDKFSFSTSSNATDVGDLVLGLSGVAGAFSSSYGYGMGGIGPPTYNNPNGQLYANEIQKVAFSTDANASDVGDLTDYKSGGSGHQSTTYGYYASGGSPVLPQNKVIEKFPFATDVNTTSTGALTTISAQGVSSLSSSTNAYLTNQIKIDKFPFATDVDATYIADLPNDTRLGQTGTSANDYGYVCGGRDPSATPVSINYIQKFSFTTDINGSDIADLTTTKRNMTNNISH